MVSDIRTTPRERCSLDLRTRSKPSTCTFREDIQRVSKELLESSVDTPPDPNISIPIHLLISETLCGWSLTGPRCETGRYSVRRKKYYHSSSYQNCENNSNSDGDFTVVETNHGSRKKRKTQSFESVENSSNPRRIIAKQSLSISGFSWKACVDERTNCYRPDNREYIHWKLSATSQLRDGIEKQSGKTVNQDRASPGSTASKPDAESQLPPEHVVEVEAGKVENLPGTHFFDFGSPKGGRLRLGDTFGSRSIREEERVRDSRCLMIGQLRASVLKKNVLPEERPSLPPIFPQPRFSRPSLSSEQRRQELRTLSVEGVQVLDASRRCDSRGEEEDGVKQTEDWLQEEEEVEEEWEEEAEEKQDSESEVDDVFESSMHDSRVNFDGKVKDRGTQVRNECNRSIEEEEGISTQLESELNRSPSTEEGQDENDTNSSLSTKADEGLLSIRRTAADRLRSRNRDVDLEDQNGEMLTGVLTISGIYPLRIGSEGSSPSGSENTTNCSDSQNASHLDASRSEGASEDIATASQGPEEKVQRETLCLDFRRSNDHPNQPVKLPRLRGVRGTKPHRSRSPPDPSRNVVDIACTKVVGVTFGGQTGHLTPTQRDVTVEMTSPCEPEEDVDTSSSSALKKCNVIEYLSQSSCRGFHSQPIGVHKRTRKTATANGGVLSLISPCADLEGKLPLITGTRVQHL